MILKAFSVRDTKGGVFNTPFFQKSHGEAERTFKELVSDEKSLISRYPEDFDLYYLGDVDLDKGTFNALDAAQHIVAAVQLKALKTQ